MKRASVLFFSAFLLFGLVSVPAMAQDVQLPLTWAGDGLTWFMGEDGVQDMEFDFSMTVSENGEVSGHSSSGSDKATVKKMYYGTVKNGVRNMVVILHQSYGDDEYLYIMDGKVLQGSLFFGDAMMMPYDKDSTVGKALNLNNSIATEIFETYMPSSLKNAMKEATLAGSFMVKGGMK